MAAKQRVAVWNVGGDYMANKKEQELQYGQMPIPQGQKTYKITKVSWSGLNKRQTIDTGVLSKESNISTKEAPYLTPSQERVNIFDDNFIGKKYQHPISMFGFDDFLTVIYRDGSKIKLDYITLNDNSNAKDIYTGVISSDADSNQDTIQRSMVQFNVYENAVDVLDGTYVKKLLIFPDKVSMFMRITVINENPNTLYEDGEISDIDTMYCYRKNGVDRFYVWNNSSEEFVRTGDDGYFMTDSLDVVVKKFYNDGYIKTEDKTYNDGYKRLSNKYYNDGFRPTNYSTFYDGYVKCVGGTYNSSSGGIYFERIGDCSPYTYLTVLLEEGDSLKGYYQRAITNLGENTNTTFYERSGTGYPYEYTAVTDLEFGDDVSGYYQKVTNSQYALVQNPIYKRTTDKFPYEYLEVTGLKYGDNISSYYEKISDKETKIKTYYKRSSGAKPYTYTEVTGLDYGSDLSNYYEKTDYFGPPENSSKSCYWYNTYNDESYVYSDDRADGESGFAVSSPPSFPNLKYAVVHLSRLFGVDDDRIHVSGFNDYSNWNLDTATESNESNAWCSAAQANTKANGEFTGITVYDNHVVCFKHDFMHEIYNSKNPFRVVDIYAEGSIDNRSIQEVDGQLIFVSDDEVKVYTGSNPRIIGYYLGIDYFKKAVSGSDGRNYYLYCVDGTDEEYLFVYDTMVQQWSQQSIDFEILDFAHNKYGTFILSDEGVVYNADTGKYDIDWYFETDMSTSLAASSSSSYPTADIKHLSKLQMLVYLEGDMKIYALYDNEPFDSDKSHLLYDSRGRKGLFPIRLKPRMTANYGYVLHFEGHGYVRIYEMEIGLTAGGELFV